MGIPISANFDSKTQRMVFRETKVIRSSFIHEGERAGRAGVPCIRRNDIESGLQLCFERRVFFFGTFAILDFYARAVPFDDLSQFISQRHFVMEEPAILAVSPSHPRLG